MNKSKIGLFFDKASKKYHLKKVSHSYNEFDQDLKWIFDSSKLELASKVEQAMNLSL